MFGKGTKSGREGDVQPDSKKAKKEVDELKHSGLSAAAKTILKAAKKAMGTAKVPCRSEEMRATMANLRAGRYGSQPGAAIIEQRVLAMLGEPTMHALFTEFETDEFGGLTTESKPWQIAAAWRLLGDIFVLHWVIVNDTVPGARHAAVFEEFEIFSALLVLEIIKNCISINTPHLHTAFHRWHLGHGQHPENF